MENLTATHQFFEKIKGCEIPFSTFERIAKDFFRAQFKEVGGVGATIDRKGWMAVDDQSPFFVLCDELAETVRRKHEFKPFVITLNGSSSGSEMAPLNFGTGIYYGLLIEYNCCTIRVLLHTGSTKVEILYDWPESWSEVDEMTNTGSGGSHRSKGYAFDLSDPDSVEQIEKRVLELCDMMPSQQGPPIVV
jgi:hypothetical protein